MGFYSGRSSRSPTPCGGGTAETYVILDSSCEMIADRVAVLPTHERDEAQGLESAKEIAKVALRLRYQIEQVVCCELDESALTDSNSRIISEHVVQTAKRAGGEDYSACVVFCLIVCLRWFKMQANIELWDADLHHGRATACEVIAKRM